MKYPTPWEADNRVFICSHQEKGKDREFSISLYIHRPGTPHHVRRVVAHPTYATLAQLRKEIDHHLGLATRSKEEEGAE